MRTSNIGLIVDSWLNIHQIIEKLTNNSTNRVIYDSISGPIQFTFVDFNANPNANYNYILVAVDPTKPLTKQEQTNLANKIPRRTPVGVVAIARKSCEIKLAEEINADFSSHIDLTSGEGAEGVRYLLSQFAAGTPNIIYDPPHILDKFQKICGMVNDRRVLSFKAATNTQVCTKADGSFKKPTDCGYTWTDFDNTKPYSWGETLYDWYAFKGECQLPDGYDATKHTIRVKFNVERNYLVNRYNDNTPCGPEGRFWYNGKTIGAIDEFHDSHIVTEAGPCELRVFTGRCLSGHRTLSFGIELTDKATEALYYRLYFMYHLIDLLEDTNPDKSRLIAIVDAAVRKLDIRNLSDTVYLKPNRDHDPQNTAFYASVPAALEILRTIKDIRGKPSADDPCTSIMGYSHLDTCWLWPYNISKYKSANTIASMLHLMENPPDEFDNPVQWRYLATAAQHYKWLQECDKDLLDRVLQAAKNGRWIVDGLSWLEHECVLLNGESMIRQMLYGKRVFEGEFGHKQNCLFLPDCFGFSAALPQVLQGFGINEFVTSKISWNEYNEFPYDTFTWRGNDGSEVMAHFITTNTSKTSWNTTYTGVASVAQLLGCYDHYKQKDVCRHAALNTIGNGDGGGGITEDMIWNINLMNELPRIQGVPAVKFPTFPELFEEIEQNKPLLPVWDGELYLEYHRGTFTSQEETKRLNRKLEYHLRNCEFLMVVLAARYGYDASQHMDTIRDIWEQTCLFEFHDALPGTTINEATIDIRRRGQTCLDTLVALESNLASILADHLNSNIAVSTKAPFYGWQTQAAANPDKYTTTITERINTKEQQDMWQELKIQWNDENPRVCDDIEFDEATKTVKTKQMTIVINEHGGIKSAVVGDREFIAESASPFNLYEDRPLNWPAWDIQRYHKEMQIDPPVFDKLEKIDNKHLKLTWHIKKAGDGQAELTTIEQVWTFSGTTIDMATFVHWTQHDKLLKYVIPTTIRARKAKFGLQFGYIERETHYNTHRDFAVFEESGRWADLSDGTGGVTLCSDIKAGFDVHGNTMMMSLLKAPQAVDKWADFGDRRFIVRIDFHNEPFSARSQILHDQITTPNAFGKATTSTKNVAEEFIRIPDNKLLLTALKLAEAGDGFIARFVEPLGGWTKTDVEFPLLEGDWTFNLVTMEELNPQPIQFKDKKITLEAKPFQVLSVHFKKSGNMMSPSKFSGNFYRTSLSIDMCGDARF